MRRPEMPWDQTLTLLGSTILRRSLKRAMQDARRSLGEGGLTLSAIEEPGSSWTPFARMAASDPFRTLEHPC